jgi:hypothetical protein
VEQRGNDGGEVPVGTLVDQRLNEGPDNGSETVVGNVRKTLKNGHFLKKSKALVAKSIGHSIRGYFKILLWKIRILPNGLMHVGAKVNGTDLC